MELQRQSLITGRLNTMEIQADPGRVMDWLKTPKADRPLVQKAFPDLTPNEREFLLTGSTPDEWDECWPDDDTL